MPSGNTGRKKKTGLFHPSESRKIRPKLSPRVRHPARPKTAPHTAGRRKTPSRTPLSLSGEQGRCAEELLDLLHAGIIERDEYNDRMRQLKMGKSS